MSLTGQELPHPGRALVLTNVRVVDVETGLISPGQSVLIEGGRITATGRVGRILLPKGARVVDGAGRYAIPGLWDMHVHLAAVPYLPERGMAFQPTAIARWALPLLIANGVTGVRDMSADLSVIMGVRDAVARGEIVGPRLVVTGRKLGSRQPVVRGAPVPVRTADDVARSVAMLKAAGADFAKVDALPFELYRTFAAEASRVHLPFVGHVPGYMDVGDLSDWGMRSVEHLQGVVIATSIHHHELLARARAEVTWWGRLLIRARIWNRRVRNRQMLTEALNTFDDSTAVELFDRFIRNGTWHTPTLVGLRDIQGLTLDDPRRKELRAYALPFLVDWEVGEGRRSDTLAAGRVSERQGMLIRAMAEYGVGLLAGTDAPGTQRLPGFSLHDELELLAGIGLSPLHVLQIATRNPAAYLSGLDTLGAIAPGQVADLLLLDANPLDNARNLRAIAGVVAAGRYLPRAELDRMLSSVRDAAAEWSGARPSTIGPKGPSPAH